MVRPDVAEVWFATAEAAEAAGFVAPARVRRLSTLDAHDAEPVTAPRWRALVARRPSRIAWRHERASGRAAAARPRVRRHRLLRLGGAARAGARSRASCPRALDHGAAGRRAGRGSRWPAAPTPACTPAARSRTSDVAAGGLGGAARPVATARPRRRRVTRLAGVLPADVVVRAVQPAPRRLRRAVRGAAPPLRATGSATDPRALDPLRRARHGAWLHGAARRAARCTRRRQRLLGLQRLRRVLQAPRGRDDGAHAARVLVAPRGRRHAGRARVVADAFCHSMVRSLVGAVLRGRPGPASGRLAGAGAGRRGPRRRRSPSCRRTACPWRRSSTRRTTSSPSGRSRPAPSAPSRNPAIARYPGPGSASSTPDVRTFGVDRGTREVAWLVT